MFSLPRLRRAVLVFADDAKADLAKRGFPAAALPLLSGLKFGEVNADVHVFSRGLRGLANCPNPHHQIGRNFAERFENAVRAIMALGYDEIVAVGRDCPSLTTQDLSLAFGQLDAHRLVLGPDHRGGCYLIAFRAEDSHLLRGVRWEKNTDCEELQNRCLSGEVLLMPVKHDLDTWADLRLFARLGERLSELAAFLAETLLVRLRESILFVDLAAQSVRVRGQIPPPAFAS